MTTDLQAFYDKATSSEDKAKALQLLSAIRSGEERPQEPCPRPHTAMPAFGKCKGQKDRVFTNSVIHYCTGSTAINIRGNLDLALVSLHGTISMTIGIVKEPNNHRYQDG